MRNHPHYSKNKETNITGNEMIGMYKESTPFEAEDLVELELRELVAEADEDPDLEELAAEVIDPEEPDEEEPVLEAKEPLDDGEPLL